MPNFKTHSIHGEIVLPQIESNVEINKEDLKCFCFGPDALIATNYDTFYYQHMHDTRKYFETLFSLIKENKLLDNGEAMAFLYGQIDHFILDLIMHPLIFYMTENLKLNYKMKPHALVENWIDDYTTIKNNRTKINYYHKHFIKDKELFKLVDELYLKAYGVKNGASKYSYGMFFMTMFDLFLKRNIALIAPFIIKVSSFGDFTYKKDYSRVLPYLNLEHDIWYDPETGEKRNESFDDLWNKSIEYSLDTIEDVNKHLYNGTPLTNRFILDDLNYDTALPCSQGQTLKYTKKY